MTGNGVTAVPQATGPSPSRLYNDMSIWFSLQYSVQLGLITSVDKKTRSSGTGYSGSTIGAKSTTNTQLQLKERLWADQL